MGSNLFLIIRGLIEFESIYKSRSKKGYSGEDPGGNYTVSMSTASEEAIMFPSGNVGLFPSKVGGEATSIRGGETASTGKDNLLGFRGPTSPASSMSSHTSPLQL